MVGDREHDVHGARANGLDVRRGDLGLRGAGELAAAGAVAVVETVDELRARPCSAPDWWLAPA